MSHLQLERGERLILRVPRAGDGQMVHDALLDGYDNFVKWLNWPSEPPSIEEVDYQCRLHHADWVLRTDMRYLCIRKDTGQVIGRFAFPDFQCVWATPLVAISYVISKSQQNKGYATEATRSLVEFAFDHLDAKKVEIKCDVDNRPSCRVPEKLGFKEESVQRGIWPKPGDALAPVRTYALFSKEGLLGHV